MVRIEYSEWWEGLLAERPRAAELEKKECVRCGMCCAKRPCMTTPEEVIAIADYLEITPERCVKEYFVIEVSRGGDSGHFILIQAKDTQMDILGEFVPWRRTYDRGFCIFYDEVERSCKIYSVRPETARFLECWDKDVEEGDKMHKETIDSWKGADFTVFGLDVEDMKRQREDEVRREPGGDEDEDETEVCHICNGSGQLDEHRTCPNCLGTGEEEE